MSVPLSRVLRGPNMEVLRDLAAVVGGPVCVRDAAGMVLFGPGDATGHLHVVATNNATAGTVTGPLEAAVIARWLASAVDREQERRALADETLARYKELALVYETSSELARQLDVEALAATVVEQARRHLGASGAAVLLHDLRAQRLIVAAAVGEAAGTGAVGNDGAEERVLRTGNPELVDRQGSTGPVPSLCAPLRSGERVLGVLRLTGAPGATWTAGDVKLVTALAANAAAAVASALLHRERVRELALRVSVERLLSPFLAEAIFEGIPADQPVAIAVAAMDLREVARDVTDPAEAPLQVQAASAVATSVMLRAGAVVDLLAGEQLIGVLRAPPDTAKARITEAAAAVRQALFAAGHGTLGVGIASSWVRPGDDAPLRAAIENAAALASKATGATVTADPWLLETPP